MIRKHGHVTVLPVALRLAGSESRVAPGRLPACIRFLPGALMRMSLSGAGGRCDLIPWYPCIGMQTQFPFWSWAWSCRVQLLAHCSTFDLSHVVFCRRAGHAACSVQCRSIAVHVVHLFPIDHCVPRLVWKEDLLMSCRHKNKRQNDDDLHLHTSKQIKL